MRSTRGRSSASRADISKIVFIYLESLLIETSGIRKVHSNEDATAAPANLCPATNAWKEFPISEISARAALVFYYSTRNTRCKCHAQKVQT